MKDLLFVVPKGAQPRDFSKLGSKLAKIGKYIGICMENGQKIV